MLKDTSKVLSLKNHQCDCDVVHVIEQMVYTIK